MSHNIFIFSLLKFWTFLIIDCKLIFRAASIQPTTNGLNQVPALQCFSLGQSFHSDHNMAVLETFVVIMAAVSHYKIEKEYYNKSYI